MHVSVHTLGCKLNQLETEALSDAFSRLGFGAPLDEESDLGGIILVNTCTVTSMADQKSRRLIRKLLTSQSRSCIIVTGCYAQLDGQDLLDLDSGKGPRRLFVVPLDQKDLLLDLPLFIKSSGSPADADLPDLIASFLSQASPSRDPDSIKGSFRFRPRSFSSHSRGFLKIQDGCDRHCSYCRVRIARGKSRSLDPREALNELKALEEGGLSEVVLTGVNISQYRHGALGLPELLALLLEGTSTLGIRLSSIEPEAGGLSKGFLRVLAHPRLRPHVHLALQSGSAPILERMGRPYGPADIIKTLGQVRGLGRDPFMACDIIAGFPGETEGEFIKTWDLLEAHDFAQIHAFPFSRRPGTAACDFSGPVREGEARARVDALMKLAQRGRQNYLDRWTGKEVDAVAEAAPGNNPRQLRGTSENYLKLQIIPSGPDLPSPGSPLRVRLEKAADKAPFDMLGVQINSPL
ncbi:MAG: radical SAM protein [Treponema sp.]|nr:radical SAM protein [Treponema sp.]